MHQFVRSSVISETNTFTQRIDKFSMRVRKGYFLGSEFQSGPSGSKWNLIIYANDVEGYDDCIDIHLKRNESRGGDQFVEVKLMIVDCLGFKRLYGKKQLSFTGSSDSHKVLSVTNMFGLMKKLRYLPDDTLTLQCEMVVYEETETTFDKEDEFENSFKNSVRRARRDFLLTIFIYFMFFLVAVVCACIAAAAVIYTIHYLIIPFVNYVLLPFFVTVILGVMILICLKLEAERIQRRSFRAHDHTPTLKKWERQSLSPVIYVNDGQSIKSIWVDKHCKGRNWNSYGKQDLVPKTYFYDNNDY